MNLTALSGPVVIKIDVQGAEPLVLRGAPEIIGRAAFLVMEYWPYGIDRLGIPIKEFLNELKMTFPYGVLLTKERYREHQQVGSLRLGPIANMLQQLEVMGTRDAYFDVLLSQERTI